MNQPDSQKVYYTLIPKKKTHVNETYLNGYEMNKPT